MKNLDESSFFTQGNGISSESESQFMDYITNYGFQYYDLGGCWHWMRKNPSDSEVNYLTCKTVTEEQRKWVEFRKDKGPGTVFSPLKKEVYNEFAKWQLWLGGYVENIGLVGLPSESSYGSALYTNSWVPAGTSGNPVMPGHFYQLVCAGKWKGGSVSGWGEVSSDRKILGSSSSEGFIQVTDANLELGNIINLSREIGYTSLELEPLKTKFKDWWNNELESYQIGSAALRAYLNSQFYASSAATIRQALQRHDGIIFREVTRNEVVNGSEQSFGKDYLIVDYNPILRTYAYINPRTVTVESISGQIVDSLTEGNQKFIYYQRSR